MATDGSESMSDEIIKFKCTPCANFNKIREAVKYCMECQGYCCQSCVDTHQAFPTLQGHHLRDKSTLKSTVLASDLPVVPTEACDIHEIKIIDMYCGDHDVVGCTSCISLEHRNCTDVQLVPDVMDTLLEESLVRKTHQKLLEMISEMEVIRASKENCLEQLKKTKEKAVSEIKEFRKELEAILEKLQEESISEVETCFNQLQSNLQNEMEKVDNEVQIMKKTALHLMKSEGNSAQQFVSVKVSQKKIANEEEILHTLQTCSELRISFAPDSNLTNCLQQLKGLGTAGHESTSAFGTAEHESTSAFGTAGHESTSVLRRKTSVYVIKTARELNVKTPDDSDTCRIFDSSLTDDCELLLADYRNNSLKRVDISKMSVVGQCRLTCSPISVCQTKEKEAVVTLDNNSIQFISLDGQMNTTRKITMNHRCYGMAFKDDRMYITNFYTSLYIYDTEGTLLQKISTDETGNNLFQDIRHVLFSDTGNKMFVTDLSKGVIALDDHRKHSQSFSDSELSAARAICSDGRGNILVGGRDSNNVLQIGTDGKKVGVVVKSSDGLRHPLSMCFNRKRCTLIITQENSNIVKFFDLK